MGVLILKEFLLTLLRSLDSIEVKGRANLDTLLGCILAVEDMIATLDAPEPAGDDPAEEDTDG